VKSGSKIDSEKSLLTFMDVILAGGITRRARQFIGSALICHVYF